MTHNVKRGCNPLIATPFKNIENVLQLFKLNTHQHKIIRGTTFNNQLHPQSSIMLFCKNIKAKDKGFHDDPGIITNQNNCLENFQCTMLLGQINKLVMKPLG